MAREPSILSATGQTGPNSASFIFFVLGWPDDDCVCAVRVVIHSLAPLLLLPFLYVCLTNSPRDSAKHAFWFGFGLFSVRNVLDLYLGSRVRPGARLDCAAADARPGAVDVALHSGSQAGSSGRFASGEPWLLLISAPVVWVLVGVGARLAADGVSVDVARLLARSTRLLAGWAPVCRRLRRIGTARH